jgi:hypothetical protein
VLRWISVTIAHLADDLEKAACYAPPLDANTAHRAPDDPLLELRNRLSHYS